MAREHAGGCLCGAARYVARGEPFDVTHCYCSMCRRSSGAGVQTFVCFASDQVEWAGKPRSYRSSPHARRGFCETCGSSLFLDYDEQQGRIWLTAGTLDDPSRVTPTLHWCAEDRPWWMPIDPELPQE